MSLFGLFWIFLPLVLLVWLMFVGIFMMAALYLYSVTIGYLVKRLRGRQERKENKVLEIKE